MAFTIFAVAPLESVIVVGWGLIPVASEKKSIASWLIILSPTFVESESVPLSATTPDAAVTFSKSFAPAFVESESVPFKIIVLLLPCSSFNKSPPALLNELSVPLRIIVLGSVSSDALVIRKVPAPDDLEEINCESSCTILPPAGLSPRDSAVSNTRISPVPDSFAMPSPIEVPSLELVSNCIGGKNSLSGTSWIIALPEVCPVPASRIIYPSRVSSAFKAILIPSTSTILSSSSKERFIPIVVTLTSLPTLKESSRAISSSSPVSNVTLTTSSNDVFNILVDESNDEMVPVWVVRVLLAAKVPVISLRVKFALNTNSGALL